MAGLVFTKKEKTGFIVLGVTNNIKNTKNRNHGKF